MGRIATRVEEQIEKLENRGMTLDFPKHKIKEILLDIGYYRLGFYWHPFEKKRTDNHQFNGGTKFSDVLSLYYLDVDLRRVLNRYLKRIELNFKTKLTYYVSNANKNQPNWFIDPKIMEENFISEFPKHYNSALIKNNPALSKHHRKYINDSYAPAWKTIEFLSFGSVVKIYKALLDEKIVETIANKYGITNTSKFVNYLDAIVYVRNKCAHNTVTFDIRLPKPLHSISEITYTNNKKSNLDAIIKVISFILKQISQERNQDMLREIETMFEMYKSNLVIRNIIENKIGFCYKGNYLN